MNIYRRQKFIFLRCYVCIGLYRIYNKWIQRFVIIVLYCFVVIQNILYVNSWHVDILKLKVVSINECLIVLKFNHTRINWTPLRIVFLILWFIIHFKIIFTLKYAALRIAGFLYIIQHIYLTCPLHQLFF